MDVVIDASIAVDWVIPNSTSTLPARDVLRKLTAVGATLSAPMILPEEVANTLLTGVRRKRWSGAAADSAYLQLMRLPLSIHEDRRDFGRAWDLSRRYDNHPIYDMLYVALAERLKANFMTADKALRARLAHLPWVVGPDQV